VELDNALATEDITVSTFEQVKRLTYLEAVINESLRIHSTSAMGLARLVPEGGLTILGKYFPPGTVLSVPSFTIHRDKDVWGEDADFFRPERWFEQDQVAIQKTFNPFSFGPRYVCLRCVFSMSMLTTTSRACVGRNLASMELLIIVSSILRRYDIVLEHPDKPARILSVLTMMLSNLVVTTTSLTPVRVSSGNLWSAKLASSAGMFCDGSIGRR
jgi:benzoate 4-monooxygenase